jgi:predicted transcriptional regulator
MADTQSVTLRVPSDLIAEIDVIADATERSRSYIIVRALKTYLLNEGAHILDAKQGREQIAAGDHEDLDDVIAQMDRMIAGKVA